MVLLLAAWIFGGIVGYVAVTIYIKNLHRVSWSEFWAMCSHGPREILKIPVYLAIWPLALGAVLYRIWYAEYIRRKMINYFDML